MAIVHIGIDLAKNVFAVHGIDEAGKPALVRPAVARARLHELIASLAPCTVAMEACSGAHHWARLFAAHGHTVRLISPKLVAPYRMGGVRGKNDAADAAAICQAVQRPSMRFVPVKSVDQQARLMVHRARQGYVEARTATINRLRGLLSELGIVLPLKAAAVRREAAQALEGLPGWANTVLGDLLSELHRLDERVAQYEQDRLGEPLGRRARAATRVLACGGGDRGEECAHGLGDARARRGLQAAGVSTMKPGARSTHPPALPGPGKGAPTTCMVSMAMPPQR